MAADGSLAGAGAAADGGGELIDGDQGDDEERPDAGDTVDAAAETAAPVDSPGFETGRTDHVPAESEPREEMTAPVDVTQPSEVESGAGFASEALPSAADPQPSTSPDVTPAAEATAAPAVEPPPQPAPPPDEPAPQAPPETDPGRPDR